MSSSWVGAGLILSQFGTGEERNTTFLTNLLKGMLREKMLEIPIPLIF